MAKQETKEVKETASKGLMKIFFVLITLLVIVIGFLSYQIFTSEALSKEGAKGVSSIFQKEEKENLFELEEFTIKLADGHFAQMSMTLGYTGKDKEMEELKPIIRDKIITEMMKLDSSYMNVNHIEGTKGIVIDKLNTSLEKSKVTNIYMSNLMVQ